ncbi:Mitochondrial import inner membrane translocase subunit TIM44 [Cichlidogyrus casuarinus]|uniref:Mitochondrial import inner membrane translocase subunit TIM44 n=1 Tax=Cichlidogyrus casuarinus TaxID=1844966 RepID=A0ABD2PWN1_9PLAT
MLRLIAKYPQIRANVYLANVLANERLSFQHASPHFCAVQKNFSQRSFLKSFLDKLKEESDKDKQMKESIKKFREGTEKLDKSDEIEKIRDLYRKIEKELPTDKFDKFKNQFDGVLKRIQEEGEQLGKHEAVKRGYEAMKKIAEATKQISETEAIKNTYEAIDKELISDTAKIYRSPKALRTRTELAGRFKERVIEANEEVQGMVLHKDSKWYAAWQDFKDNNKVAQKFFDFQTKLDETDHPVFNSMRYVRDRFSALFGSSGSSNEIQQVLDEITKMDPSFSLEGFLRFCRFDPYSVISTPIKQAQELGLKFDNHILDVSHVDLQLGKMMEQGPVLLITFQTQQIACLRDVKTNEVRDGDPNKVLRISHVWALCRDQNELHPYSSWRILEIGMMPSEQWV